MKTFKICRQHDAMQCGVACLQMVCRHYGRRYTLEQLSEVCFATSEGVSLQGISQAAQTLGLDTMAVTLPVEELRELPCPCILHWKQVHFVVLYGIERTRRGTFFLIADPGKGRVRYAEREFCDGWATTQRNGTGWGIAMTLSPNAGFGTYQSPIAARRESPYRFLLHYVRGHRRHFLAIFLGLALGCAIQLALPFLTQAVVDVGIKRNDLSVIKLILIGQLVLTFSRTAVDFVRRRLLLTISVRINIALINDFFVKLLRLPMSFFETKQTGDLLQRMDDHRRVEQFLTSQALAVVFSVLSFVSFSIVLLLYSRLVFAVFLGGSLLYGGWVLLLMPKRRTLNFELFEQQAINNDKTYQFVTPMQEVKLQDCEQRRRDEWTATQNRLFEVRMKSLKLQQYQETGSVLINEVKNIVVTILTATAVVGGDMTLGMMLAVQYIIGQLNSPIEQIMAFAYSIQDVSISMERIGEIHTMRNEEREGSVSALPTGDRSIRLRDVCFKYDPHSSRQTISHVSLTIPEGKVTAIVGASGSGKTTLLKLILGYYRLQGGSVDVGGVDLERLNLKWWRSQCGVVMQNGVIFSESIARNVAVGDGDIDEQRLCNAERIAQIYDFVDELPLKQHTLIGQNGLGISQGQKQRILIARAVYKNPQFVILDEATNSLDAMNEQRIVKEMEKFYQGRTVVIVAHRLSTVRNADQIVVIDGGRVVENGTHAALIARQGTYFNLVKNQLELGN